MLSESKIQEVYLVKELPEDKVLLIKYMCIGGGVKIEIPRGLDLDVFEYVSNLLRPNVAQVLQRSKKDWEDIKSGLDKYDRYMAVYIVHKLDGSYEISPNSDIVYKEKDNILLKVKIAYALPNLDDAYMVKEFRYAKNIDISYLIYCNSAYKIEEVIQRLEPVESIQSVVEVEDAKGIKDSLTNGEICKTEVFVNTVFDELLYMM